MQVKKTFFPIRVVALFLLSMTGFVFSQWSQQTVTMGLGWVQEAQVAEGRNDGIDRLYLASPGTNAIYEFSWNGSTWDPVKIDSSSYQMRDICAGSGRNDNVIRIYSTDEGGALIEHTWTGTSWQIDTVGQANSLGVIVGSGRNDGITRVYSSKPAGSAQNCIYEYTWNGGGWSIDSMQGGASWYYKPTLGIGRNDDTIRVYCPNWDGHVYEFTWNGGWNVLDVADAAYANDIYIGPGRDDGINRLYCGNSYGHILEYTWNGFSWILTSDLQPTNSTYMREVHIGNGRNDSTNNLYCAGQNAGLVEYKWSGSDWQVGNLGDAIDGLTIGSGRDDGVMRVYAASVDAVVEYTFDLSVFENRPTYNNDFQLNAYPNPFQNKVTIKISENGKNQKYAGGKIKIYDASGRMVKFLQVQEQASTPSFIIWDGTDDNNHKLPDGIYFLQYSAQGSWTVHKILKVK